MIINCVWEHNGKDTLLYAIDYIGAYTRGERLEIAKAKIPQEIVSYLKWLGEDVSDSMEIVIAQEKDSELAIKDADSDVLFESEKAPFSADEMYEHTKNVNEYYFAEIAVDADNGGTIYECRGRGFEALEAKLDFLKNGVTEGSYGEDWSLRKVLRRFILHDRIPQERCIEWW